MDLNLCLEESFELKETFRQKLKRLQATSTKSSWPQHNSERLLLPCVTSPATDTVMLLYFATRVNNSVFPWTRRLADIPLDRVQTCPWLFFGTANTCLHAHTHTHSYCRGWRKRWMTALSCTFFPTVTAVQYQPRLEDIRGSIRRAVALFVPRSLVLPNRSDGDAVTLDYTTFPCFWAVEHMMLASLRHNQRLDLWGFRLPNVLLVGAFFFFVVLTFIVIIYSFIFFNAAPINDWHEWSPQVIKM